MRNEYLEALEKIEFVVTYACTGNCKHCSEGAHERTGKHIEPKIAADIVRKVAAVYDIKTVMTFGGEPLLYPEITKEVMTVASALNIPRRQVITNGYFTKDKRKIKEVAEMLKECGVNDLLLSVDAFHQETIPLDTVKIFAAELKSREIPVRLSPAWLVSADDENPYNRKTREILASFADLGLVVGEGNVVFPEGNALKFLPEYFKKNAVKNPYTEDPCQIKCLSVEPDGGVLGGNVYRQDVMEIIKSYSPKVKCDD